MTDTEWFAVQRHRDGVYLVGEPRRAWRAVSVLPRAGAAGGGRLRRRAERQRSFAEGQDCFGTPVKQASFNDFSIVVARDFAALA